MPQSDRPVSMAGYGVAESLEGILPWAWAEERLNTNRNFWVTTVDERSRPHSMPVWGVWVPDTERFWFSCSADSFKARNLATNPHVVVANTDTVEVVSIEGTAAQTAASQAVATSIGEKYETDPEKQATLAGFMMQQDMFEVTPVKAFGLIESEEQFSSSATRWTWH